VRGRVSALSAVGTLALIASVGTAANNGIGASDSVAPPWTAQVGGFHYLMDVQVLPRSSEMWGVGSGIARADVLGRWAVTDWVPGYQLTGLGMTSLG